jgi:hypothetical protein
MRGNDLPDVVELLEVHGAVSLDLLLRIWESGRPPGKGECEIRFQQLDLNAFGLDEPHRTTIEHFDQNVIYLLGLNLGNA